MSVNARRNEQFMSLAYSSPIPNASGRKPRVTNRVGTNDY
jgi:hypothetical protein